MSVVNGLGVYLISSLGFVFAAMVEFAIVITLKRVAMNKKKIAHFVQEVKQRMSRDSCKDISETKQKIKKSKIMDADQDLSKRVAFNVADEKCKGAELGRGSDGKKPLLEDEPDMALLRKIDIVSFFAYLLGYILFNIFYWLHITGNI